MFELMRFLKNNRPYILIFLVSTVCSILVLYLERLVGIGYDYHPDSRTYLAVSGDVFNNALKDPSLLLFNSYYVIVGLLDKSVALILALNILLYSLTNTLIYSKLIKFSKTKLSFFAIVLFLLNPYRLHLSIHILKDTVLIFLLVIAFFVPIYLRFAPIFFSYRAILYIPAYMKYKNIFYIFGLILTVIYYSLLGWSDPWDWIYNNINSNFSFNDYDKVPNFKDYGLYGAFLRAIIWPIFFLSGVFFFTSPTPLFFPLLIGQITSQFVCFQLFRRPLISLGSYLTLAFLALIISGFTTYFRYAAPILLIVPMTMAKNARKISV